ncbi:lipoprotein N-acyltransferase Lnb domain-containing protein [Spongiimicrobium salis]|uniref:lipoprotein N-acyltransferase Lnb domain-containing protein n=1 Tax=Spongiimicrobium salis TaxID=1667022 RepID=UPI00374D4F85
MKKILLGFLFCYFSFGYSQEINLSPQSTISVLTCGPGADLYTAFGHSAFRVQDPVLGIDVVYNYGTFNFNRPGFYTDFVKGKLIFSLSRQRTTNFLNVYEFEKRWVKEQELQLTLAEKNTLLKYLENNNRPENKTYTYDYLYDNCSSKIRDVLDDNLGKQIVYDTNFVPSPFTFRELIHQKLPTNSWGSFGIDLALSSVIDVKASVQEHHFLPDYMFQQLVHTTKNNAPFVTKERTLLKAPLKQQESSFLSTPLFWFCLFLLLVGFFTYLDYKRNTRRRWLDFFIFLVSGAPGLLLFFLWFFTDHGATAGNFNMLWAFPLNTIVAFFVLRKNMPKWISSYLILSLLLLLLTLVSGVLGLQVFSPLIIPLCLTLGLRYAFLFVFHKKARQLS